MTMTSGQFEQLKAMLAQQGENKGDDSKNKYKDHGAGALFPPLANRFGHRYFVIKDCASSNGKGCICAGSVCAENHIRRELSLEHEGVRAFEELESAISWYFEEYPNRWLAPVFK